MQEIRELLKDLPNRIGATVFLSSHLLDEIQKTANYVGLLHKGEMILESSLSDLLKNESSSMSLSSNDTIAIKDYFSKKNIKSQIISENENEVNSNLNKSFISENEIASLKKEMNVERDEAQHFYNGFFEQFPKATAFLEATKQYARDNGHTETLFGRRRQFRSINAKLPFIRAMAERMALNAPIQGTAADIIKIAMVHVYEQLLKEYHSARLILQIHDEIIYEVDETRAEDFSKKVITIMENVFKDSYIHFDSKVPLVVHTSIGKNWGELK